MPRKTIITVLLLAVFFIIVGAAVDYIILTVNDEPVTYLNYLGVYSQYMKIAKSQNQTVVNPKQTVMDYMIQNILLRQEAKKKGIVVSDDDVMSQINGMLKSYNMTFDQLQQQLAGQGLTLTDFIENQRNQILYYQFMKYVIEPKLTKPSQDELNKFYVDNKNTFKGSVAYEATSIRLTTPKDSGFKDKLAAKRAMEALLAELTAKGGIPTADWVKAYADDKKLVLFFENKVFYPELEEKDFAAILAKLPEGTLSTVIQYKDDFYILILQKKTVIDTIPFPAVKDKILNYLTEQHKIDAYNAYMKKAKDNATITWFVTIESVVIPDAGN